MARKDPLSHLGRHDTLSPVLAKEVRALGSAALPKLRALLLDPQALGGTDEAAARAASNAASILAGWPGAEASAILLEAFATVPPGSMVSVRVTWVLRLRGPEVVEPLLVFRGTDRASEAVDVLAHVAPADPRVVDWIVERLREDPEEGASLAEISRSPDLVAPLEAAFDERMRARTIGEQARVLIALLEAAAQCGSTEMMRGHALRVRLEREVGVLEEEVDGLRRLEAVLERGPRRG